jgi:hypothetical protein
MLLFHLILSVIGNKYKIKMFMKGVLGVRKHLQFTSLSSNRLDHCRSALPDLPI